MTILDEIAARTSQRIEARKAMCPLDALATTVRSRPILVDFPFERALATKGISLIAEVKRASPSTGVIAHDFPYQQIATQYERAGVEAISVLTEPHFFLGADHYLWEIADLVELPLLRKDFTIDEYMIYEARLLGASAVLLICSLLTTKTLADYITTAHELGLSALVEAHDEAEVDMALEAGARIIGVNNRDLKTFDVDLGLSEKLRSMVPSEVLFVSESGIRAPQDISRLREIGVDAVLVGGKLMAAADKTAEIRRLRGDHGQG